MAELSAGPCGRKELGRTSSPVRDNESLEVKFLLDEAVENLGVVTGICLVDPVVRAHY